MILAVRPGYREAVQHMLQIRQVTVVQQQVADDLIHIWAGGKAIVQGSSSWRNKAVAHLIKEHYIDT
jgi:hypothetical protein